MKLAADSFLRFDLGFLEALTTKTALLISWESLSRSVIIDLGSQRPQKSWQLRVMGE